MDDIMSPVEIAPGTFLSLPAPLVGPERGSAAAAAAAGTPATTARWVVSLKGDPIEGRAAGVELNRSAALGKDGRATGAALVA